MRKEVLQLPHTAAAGVGFSVHRVQIGGLLRPHVPTGAFLGAQTIV